MNPPALRRGALGSALCAGVLLGFCGCVGGRGASRPMPRFQETLPAPLALRVRDLRPEVERQPVVSPDWLYGTTRSEEVPLRFARYAGNALNAFRAIPGYRILPADFPVDSAPFVLDIELRHAYARWPVRRVKDADKIDVEGFCQVIYILYKDGRALHRGILKAAPPPFRVPVSLVRSDNVEKIVGDSLAFQLDKSMTAVLDQLMLDLAKRWPRYAQESAEKKASAPHVR